MNDEVLAQLENLDIDEFKTSLKVFESPHKPIKADILYKASQDPNGSKIILDLLQKSPTSVLKGLKAIGDKSSTIIVNVVQFTDEKDHCVSQVLNTIKNLLKNYGDNFDTPTIEFYLLTSLNLISQFEVEFVGLLSTLLKFLTPSYEESDIQATVLLIVLKSIEKNQQQTFDAIHNFFDYVLETESNFAHFLNLIKSLELLFPICPTVCGQIYTSNGCKEAINEHIKRITPTSLKNANDILVTRNVLKLVSSSCISDECRKFNAENYLQVLKVGSRLDLKDFTELKILSTLCTIKLWNFLQIKDDFQVTMNDLFDINIQYLIHRTNYDQAYLEYSIESLAYLTLNPSLRISLRSNQSAIEAIISIIIEKSDTKDKVLDNSHSSIVYGLLLIMSNLMQIKDENAGSQDSKTINYLKLVSTTKSSTDTTKENKDEILNFSKSMILDHKLLSLISKLKIIKISKQGSNNNSDKLILIIYYAAMNQNKQVRQELVKQGALNSILDYLILVSKVNLKQDGQTRPLSTSTEAIETRLQGIRAMAKILILVNPGLAFNKYNITTCLPFLVELLGPDITNYSGELTNKNATDAYLYNEVNNVDKYESLLALTNISSLPDDKDNIKDVIISKTFDKYLNNFIIETDVPFVQKASWELITNLVLKPSMLVKFFNVDDKQSMKRLDLLINMLELTDLSLQVILAGLLANATSEFEMIGQVLVQQPIKKKLVPLLARVFSNQAKDDHLILRLSFLLLDLVYVAANLSMDKLQQFKGNKDLKASLSKVIQTNKNREILEVLVEVIKFVKFE